MDEPRITLSPDLAITSRTAPPTQPAVPNPPSVKAIRAQLDTESIAAAERRGYEQAITHLRDGEAFWIFVQDTPHPLAEDYLSARLTEETTP